MARDTAGKKRRILVAALECISLHGYEATRLSDVGRAAGVSVGVIQHYFGTREHLLAEALGYASGQLIEHFETLGAENLSPWQQLRGMIRVVCEMPDLHRRGLLWLEMTSLGTRHPHLRTGLDSVYALWRTHVREAVVRGIDDGSLRPLDGVGRGAEETVDDLVAVFLAFFDGYEYEIASSLVPADADTLERRALLLAERLFRPVSTAGNTSA